jgi:hypothetical protein
MKNTNFINLKKLTNIYFKNTNRFGYFKDRSSRMPIYVWDELYIFKGSYSIRITQGSSEVIHRKCLLSPRQRSCEGI